MEIIGELRKVVTPILVKLEMVLASQPNVVQMEQDELKIQTINYNTQTITARLLLDNFLNTETTSERYAPTNFPGIF